MPSTGDLSMFGGFWARNGVRNGAGVRALPVTGSQVLPGTAPSLFVTRPVVRCLWRILLVQLEHSKTYCQSLKGGWALDSALEFNGLLSESLPLICHKVTVLETPMPFSQTSSWHQHESQREKEQILFDFCFSLVTPKVGWHFLNHASEVQARQVRQILDWKDQRRPLLL